MLTYDSYSHPPYEVTKVLKLHCNALVIKSNGLGEATTTVVQQNGP
jgi:hypothetical protein